VKVCPVTERRKKKKKITKKLLGLTYLLAIKCVRLSLAVSNIHEALEDFALRVQAIHPERDSSPAL
jgi:hypothetical protein